MCQEEENPFRIVERVYPKKPNFKKRHEAYDMMVQIAFRILSDEAEPDDESGLAELRQAI